MMRRLLERVRVPDELRLAERRPGEGDAEGRGLWVEVRIGFVDAGTVQVGEESRRHDDARVSARAGGLAPKLAGNRTASNFLPLQVPLSATSPSQSLRTAPAYRTARAPGLVRLRSSAR